MKNPFSKIISDESWALSEKRYEAFWNGSVADRPPVSLILRGEQKVAPPVRPNYETLEQKWLDHAFRALEISSNVENNVYYSDAMPTAFPNIGPEVFTAFCGAPYFFTATTAWTEPCIIDWDKDSGKAVVDFKSKYFAAVENFTRELLKYSKDRFAVGFTDFHGGGDHLAALRDPEVLCTDLYDYPDEVKAKIKSSNQEFFKVYDHFHGMISGGGSPSTAWIPLVVDGRYNVVQNDFSCMVSAKMFEEFFLDGIKDECDHLDRCIYHLDGPNALIHLDALLKIPNLQAIQWVPGAGNDGYERWIKVYQKIQKAGKGVYLTATINDLDRIFETLTPEGIWFPFLSGVNTKEDADYALARIAKWK